VIQNALFPDASPPQGFDTTDYSTRFAGEIKVMQEADIGGTPGFFH
jgi:hypothetical protein